MHGVAADIVLAVVLGAPMSQLAGLFLVCTVVVAGGEVLQSVNQGFVPQEYVPASHSSKYLCFTHIGYLTDASESFLVVKKEGYNMGCIVASGLPTGNRLGQRSFPSAHVAHFLVNGKHVCCEVVPSPDGSFPSIRVDVWDQDYFTRNDWLGGVTLSGMEAGPQHYNMPEHHDSVTSLFSESDTRGTFDLDLVVVEQPDPAEYVVRASAQGHRPLGAHATHELGPRRPPSAFPRAGVVLDALAAAHLLLDGHGRRGAAAPSHVASRARRCSRGSAPEARHAKAARGRPRAWRTRHACTWPVARPVRRAPVAPHGSGGRSVVRSVGGGWGCGAGGVGRTPPTRQRDALVARR